MFSPVFLRVRVDLQALTSWNFVRKVGTVCPGLRPIYVLTLALDWPLRLDVGGNLSIGPYVSYLLACPALTLSRLPAAI